MSLREVDQKILEELGELQRSSPREISERIDYDRTYVYQRLKNLLDKNLVERPSRGIYVVSSQGTDLLEDR